MEQFINDILYVIKGIVFSTKETFFVFRVSKDEKCYFETRVKCS
jgi:hypothetical protein